MAELGQPEGIGVGRVVFHGGYRKSLVVQEM